MLKTQKTHRFSASTSWNWLYFSAYFSRILNMYTNIIMPYKEDTHPGVLLFAGQPLFHKTIFTTDLSDFILLYLKPLVIGSREVLR